MRTRVASSDWWASRKVVSVTATVVLLAQPAGELLGTELEQQLARAVRRRDVEVDAPGSLVTGSTLTGASPCGWLTVTSAR